MRAATATSRPSAVVRPYIDDGTMLISLRPSIIGGIRLVHWVIKIAPNWIVGG